MSQKTKINFRNQCLIIDSKGGGIARYYFMEKGQEKDIIYGYKKDQEKDGGMEDVYCRHSSSRAPTASYCLGAPDLFRVRG